jgi:ribosomal protein S18 acetylase RimI-like enzyme
VGRLYVDRWEKEIRIMDIAVLPEFRGTGIGTKLIRDLQEEARAAGKSLSIHVEKFNRALGLYERMEFLKKGDREVYWLMEWRGEL